MDSAENVQTIPGMACLLDPVKLKRIKEGRKEGELSCCTIKKI